MFALIDVIVIFVIRVTRGAVVVIAWCPLMQPGCYQKFFPTKFRKELALLWKPSIENSKVGPINIVKRVLTPMEP
jgi:hypothetical protein